MKIVVPDYIPKTAAEILNEFLGDEISFDDDRPLKIAEALLTPEFKATWLLFKKIPEARRELCLIRFASYFPTLPLAFDRIDGPLAKDGALDVHRRAYKNAKALRLALTDPHARNAFDRVNLDGLLPLLKKVENFSRGWLDPDTRQFIAPIIYPAIHQKASMASSRRGENGLATYAISVLSDWFHDWFGQPMIPQVHKLAELVSGQRLKKSNVKAIVSYRMKERK